jgi:hypothetical protein
MSQKKNSRLSRVAIAREKWLNYLNDLNDWNDPSFAEVSDDRQRNAHEADRRILGVRELRRARQ